MNRLKIILVVFFALSTHVGLHAQRAAVSTDALKWVTLTPNLSVELMLTSRTTLNIEGSVNPFGELGDNLKLTHATISPEFRFWFKRPHHSHFVGVNMLAAAYDLRFKSHAVEGRTIAAGLTYGYAFILNDRWSLTPTIGLGGGCVYDTFDSTRQFKPMITKLGVGFTYIIN